MYPTAEGTCNGVRFNGLGFCVLQPGDSAMITIQGYYQGTVRIDSDRCQLAQSLEYRDSQPLSWTVKPADSCVIDVVVSPQFPHPGTIGVSSFKGRIYVKSLQVAGQTYQTFVDKVAAGTDKILELTATDASRVVVQGCGAKLNDAEREPVDGKIQIHLSELKATSPDCLFEGAVITGTTVQRFGWQVWSYDKAFSPLPEPAISEDGSSLHVFGDPTVSVITWDAQYVINDQAKFSLTPGPHLLRLITVKGRLLLGLWDGKAFQWIN